MFHIPVTSEFIWSMIVIIFLAGGYFSVIKKMEQKLKDAEKDLQSVMTSQAVHNEKITKIDDKINKMEMQNIEIIKLLTLRNTYEKVIT